MSEPLSNARHEKYAQLVATGQMSQRDAYENVYGLGINNATSLAARLSTKVQVFERIVELQAKSEDQAVLSFVEKRAFLRSVVVTPVGKIDETSPLAQKVKRSTRKTRDGDSITDTEIESPNKLKALELDARLAGELDEGNRGNGAQMVNIQLLGVTLDGA